MRFEPAKRIASLPPYMFVRIEKKVSAMRRTGKDIISFGIGDPDLPPPPEVMRVLRDAASKETFHKYPPSQGEDYFRTAVSTWYRTRFGVHVDKDANVCALIGSKEGIANIARGFVNPGDHVLVPDPGYPVYANGSTLLCDAIPDVIPLQETNSFLPNLDCIRIGKARPKLLYLNYPNNPTGAVADKKFLKKAVDFALSNRILLAYDNAYSEMTYDGYVAPSIFEVPGAMECAVEFHSLSKTFNMTGDRIGFAVGNESAISVLKNLKSQVDSGIPPYIQMAGATALGMYSEDAMPRFIQERNAIYEKRLYTLSKGLSILGIPARMPKGTFYLFVRVGPSFTEDYDPALEMSSLEFTERLLETGVVVTPGNGFGAHGDGYVRFAATQPLKRIQEALERIEDLALV